MSSLSSFRHKLFAAKADLRGVIKSYPARISRFGQHILRFRNKEITDKSVPALLNQPVEHLVDLFFYFLDLVAFGELYDICSGFIKLKTRVLSKEEIELAKTVYGDSIDYARVRIDEAPKLVPARGVAAYVGVNTINFVKEKTDTLYIHELIHIWQYQNLGSIYIPRALRAQRTNEGYNYNGNEGLAFAEGQSILTFNYEQQGDIARDYFCILNGRPCLHEKLPQVDLYLPFINELRNKGKRNPSIA